jgi:diacylglycerol kinase family enzyme
MLQSSTCPAVVAKQSASDFKHFAVVANANSGAVSLLGETALLALVTDVLGPNLHSCEIAESESIVMALERAIASRADVLVIIGGDGTCRAAAALARKADKPVAFLPGGTMNLLPGRHWPNLDLTASLIALSRGTYELAAMDVGLANEEIFLIAAAFGAAPALARLREAHRASETLTQSVVNLLRVPSILPHLVRPSARVEARGVPRRHLAALAMVLGNADIALGRREIDADTHMLECVVAEVTSPWAFIAVMVRAFFDRNWRQNAKVTTTQIEEGKVFSKSRSIAMTLDGEVIRLPTPAIVRIVVNGLRVLVHKLEIGVVCDPPISGNKSIVPEAAKVG